jgi:hypothetical protein
MIVSIVRDVGVVDPFERFPAGRGQRRDDAIGRKKFIPDTGVCQEAAVGENTQRIFRELAFYNGNNRSKGPGERRFTGSGKRDRIKMRASGERRTEFCHNIFCGKKVLPGNGL